MPLNQRFTRKVYYKSLQLVPGSAVVERTIPPRRSVESRHSIGFVNPDKLCLPLEFSTPVCKFSNAKIAVYYSYDKRAFDSEIDLWITFRRRDLLLVLT
jgi:hypothetical protein